MQDARFINPPAPCPFLPYVLSSPALGAARNTHCRLERYVPPRGHDRRRRGRVSSVWEYVLNDTRA
eukprot:7939413-Pyramimonas_sp.AAC.1